MIPSARRRFIVAAFSSLVIIPPLPAHADASSRSPSRRPNDRPECVQECGRAELDDDLIHVEAAKKKIDAPLDESKNDRLIPSQGPKAPEDVPDVRTIEYVDVYSTNYARCPRETPAWVSVKYVDIDRAGRTVREYGERSECRAVSDLPQQAPPLAPRPPEQALIRDEIIKHLPHPRVSVDPTPRGLTGLEARFWHEDDTQANWQLVDHDRNSATPAIPALVITARAGAFSITAQAWPTAYRWEIQPKTQPGTPAGRDRVTLTSAHPGSREQPAARYAFQTKGLYSVTEVTTWTGTYTWQGPGGQGNGQLGSVLLERAQDYPVIQVRSALVG